MGNKQEYTLKEAIKELLKAYNLEERMAEIKLNAAWEEIMGATIAKHTIKITHHQKNHVYLPGFGSVEGRFIVQ